MDAPTRLCLAPRLVLVFAVLACLFGWGNAVAAAAGQADQDRTSAAVASAAHADRDAHTGAHAARADALVPLAESPASSDGGHGGHGSGHDHALTCMVSSAAAAFGAAPVPDALAPVISAVPPVTRAQQAGLPATERRAPGIATLCVLRT